MRRLWWLTALVAACRTPLLPAPADAGADAARCSAHALVPLPTTMFGPEDLNLCPAAAVRIDVFFEADACQALGPPLVDYDGANGYHVRMQAWTGTECGQRQQQHRTVFLSETARPAPGTVTVHDGTVSTPIPIQSGRPDGTCNPVNGGGCGSDAQCSGADPTQRCWLDGGACTRICFGDADCPDATPHCNGGYCFAAGPACASCPFGQLCAAVGNTRACRPAPTATPGRACASDSDCGAGSFCDCHACVQPCATDGDCSVGRCDGARGCVR